MRMSEADLTSEILVVMLEGIQRRRLKIKELYKNNDDLFEEKARIVKEFKSVIDIIERCFGDTLINTIFNRRILFYSLFCSFYHKLYGIPKTPELDKGADLRNPNHSILLKIRDALFDLSNRYKGATLPQEIHDFKIATQKGTNERENRILRIKTITNYIDKALLNQ